MEYSKLVAVSGMPGLFELINSKTDGAIMRSLEDQTTRFVSSRVHSFSHLESIEVYTTRDNVNLVEVFEAMGNSKTALPDDKEAKEVKSYFEKVYPEMDFERVYASDMKKMVKWFDILTKNKVEIKLSEPEEEEETEEVVDTEEEEAEETPAPAAKKKPAAKKTAAKKKDAPAKKTTADKKEPAAKKAAAPKKAAKKKS